MFLSDDISGKERKLKYVLCSIIWIYDKKVLFLHKNNYKAVKQQEKVNKERLTPTEEEAVKQAEDAFFSYFHILYTGVEQVIMDIFVNNKRKYAS